MEMEVHYVQDITEMVFLESFFVEFWFYLGLRVHDSRLQAGTGERLPKFKSLPPFLIHVPIPLDLFIINPGPKAVSIRHDFNQLKYSICRRFAFITCQL